jgi:hypothetical protein
MGSPGTLEFTITRTGRNGRVTLKAAVGDRVLHVEKLDILCPEARDRCRDRICANVAGANPAAVDRELLQLAARHTSLPARSQGGTAAPTPAAGQQQRIPTGNGVSGGIAESELIRLSTVQPQPVRWLWPDCIPLGKLSLIVGDPGVGKSMLTVDMAARVSTGAAWPLVPNSGGPAGEVIILSAEDDPADTIRPRLDAAGADASRIVVLSAVKRTDPSGNSSSSPFSLERDIPVLDAAIKKTPGVRLVIVDPISAYLGKTDSHKNAEVRTILAPLAKLAADQNVAVAAITHLSKSLGGKALYRAIGSVAFTGAARSVWFVGADGADPARRLMLPLKNNLAPEPLGLGFRIRSVQTASGISVARVDWEPNAVTTTANEAIAAELEAPRDRSARDEAAEFLRDLLKNGPVPASEVLEGARAANIKEKTLRRAKVEIGVKVGKTGNDTGSQWHWRLSDTATRPTEDGQLAMFEGDGHLRNGGHLPNDSGNGSPLTDFVEFEV